MSCYMVDRHHIEYLINAALALGARRYDGEETALGQMLWDENKASVTYRYPRCAEDELPGRIGEVYVYDTHRLDTPTRIDAVQTLKAINCYTYQACEHPGWETSAAKRFCDGLRDTAISKLPGYEDAVWGAPEPLHVKGRT